MHCVSHSYIVSHSKGHLNNIIGPQAKQCIGAHTYTTTHRNKTVNVNKMKHTFIVLVLTTNKCLNNKKNMPYTTYIDWHGVPKLVGPPGNCIMH